MPRHRYVPPVDITVVDDDDVHAALLFLIAIEADADNMEAYRAAMAPYEPQITQATATLRAYARQAEPQDLETLRRLYYAFTDDPRYLTSGRVSSIVTSALDQAWHGVGGWQR